MAQQTYRANLSAKSFPFISTDFGRSVIVSQYDNTFNRSVVSQEDTDRDIGIPQIYYAHNVMPRPQGFQSVGYIQIVPPQGTGAITDFQQIFIIRDDKGNKVFCAVSASKGLFTTTGPMDVWSSRLVVPIPGPVYFAYVDGITYIWINGIGCYKFDFTTLSFVVVTLVGLSIPDVLGITGSAGYLVAWTINSVAWSSTVDPTDFTPSLITGAGGGSVEGTRGAINFCKAHTLGFIVYTENNAVAALFSGNSRFPFNFREIVNSGGVTSPNLTGYDSSSGNQYVYSTSGVQLVSTSATQTVFPEITDFVAGQLFEDFNETTNQIVQTILTGTMQKEVHVISDRYMVISYGISSLTHAIVYDLVQKRYGKLKIPHTDMVEYELPSPLIQEIPRQSLGFLQANGRIVIVDFSVSSAGTSGVMILGKYQLTRARAIQMNTVALENIRANDTFNLLLWTAVDGKNDDLVTTPVLIDGEGIQRTYGCRAEGLNHSLVFLGGFSIVSLVLQFNIGGKR